MILWVQERKLIVQERKLIEEWTECLADDMASLNPAGLCC